MNKLNALLALSWFGTIASFATNAKAIFQAGAALASLIASCYAIAIARRRLKPSKPTRARRTSRLKKLRRAVAGLFTLTLIVGLTGCSTPGNQSGQSVFNRIAEFPGRVLDSTASLVTTTITNVIEQPVIITNSVLESSATFSNSVHSPQSSELRVVTNTILVTNLVAIPSAGIIRAVDTAETASAFLPPPYGEAAAGGLAIISGLLAAAVRRRNTMLKTVIQGVEDAGVPNVKEAIAGKALENGVLPALHALVKDHTR